MHPARVEWLEWWKGWLPRTMGAAPSPFGVPKNFTVTRKNTITGRTTITGRLTLTGMFYRSREDHYYREVYGNWKV